MIKDYLSIIKPGIVRGNAITAFAGFMFASDGNFNLLDLISCVLGLSLVVASACVVNNIIDFEIDNKMSRTKFRVESVRRISKRNALIFSIVLLIIGLTLLVFVLNFLSAFIASIGFIFYVFVYAYFKRTSVYGTEVGSISGAIPPVVGYVAVTNKLDPASLLLFSVLIVWQMPHFYAVGIRRINDYKSASIPILPIIKGINYTKKKSLIYIFCLLLIQPLFTFFGYTGILFFIATSLVTVYWLFKGFKSLSSGRDKKWANEMFSISLMVLLVFCIFISFNAWLF